MRTYNVTASHQKDLAEHCKTDDPRLAAKLHPLAHSRYLTLTNEEAQFVAACLPKDHEVTTMLKEQLATGLDDSEKVVVFSSLEEMKFGDRVYTDEQIEFIKNLERKPLTATPLPLQDDLPEPALPIDETPEPPSTLQD